MSDLELECIFEQRQDDGELTPIASAATSMRDSSSIDIIPVAPLSLKTSFNASFRRPCAADRRK